MAKNVLFVESDSPNSSSVMGSMTTRILTHYGPGYNMVEAAKGESDALEKLRANGDDLNLVIVNMVEVGEIQTIKAIREANKKIPIIGMVPMIGAIDPTDPRFDDSATPMLEMIRAAISVGASDLIPKPFKPDALLKRVIKLIGEP